MKVYRIEHTSLGLGPYQGGAKMTFDYYGDRHPDPGRDGIFLMGSRDFFFGFSNMRQMFQWFHWTDVFRWQRHGFRVYKYTMPRHKVLVGGRQVAFVKAEAKDRHEVRMAQLAKHLIRIPLLGS